MVSFFHFVSCARLTFAKAATLTLLVVSWVVAAPDTASTLETAVIETVQVVTKHPNGQINESYRVINLKSGESLRDGLAEEFYPDGRLKGKVPWKAGKQDGDAVFYHPDGQKSYATHYRMGKKWGFATVWYTNGQKQWEAMYQDGLTHGIWREWYRDGKRKFTAMYSKGRLDGRATWWYPNGRLQQERDYSLGESVPGTVKAYDSTGRQTFPAPPGSQPGSPQGRNQGPVSSGQDEAMAESLLH